MNQPPPFLVDNPVFFVIVAVVAVVTFTITMTLFSLAARRILGMQVGFLRGVIAGLIGLMVCNALLQLPWRVEGTHVSPAWIGVFTVSLGFGLLVAMIFLVALEAAAASGLRIAPIQWLRALRRAFGRGRRYSKITMIAFRHGLGPYLRGRRTAPADGGRKGQIRLAQSVREALEEGGVTFVKLGQVLSTRRDVLPIEFVEELSKLQDQVPPAPWDQIDAVLTSELNARPSEVFAEISSTPLAAASVAQVHKAKLKTGQDVVVKVQRPDIRKIVDRDLDIVIRLARTLEVRTSWGRSFGAVALAEGFAEALREELDFEIEARNVSAVSTAARDRGGDIGVVLPTVYEEMSTSRVLVLGELVGTPLGAAESVVTERALDRLELGRALLGAILKQVMLDGVFHADPHPGNVFLLADNRLGLLDFGSVGRLDGMIRTSLQHLLLSLERGDPAGMRDSLLEIVTRPEEIDEQRLERALGRFMARHLGAGSTPDLAMFSDLFRLIAFYELAIPPEVAAVFRALATLEGTLAQLSPGFNIVTEARAFATSHLTSQLTGTSLRETATAELMSLLPMLRRLPRRIDRISSALEQGRFSVNVRLFSDERDRRYASGLLHQLVLTFLAAAAGFMAVYLLGSDEGPPFVADVSLYQLFGYNILLIGCVLALRVLYLTFRAPRRE